MRQIITTTTEEKKPKEAEASSKTPSSSQAAAIQEEEEEELIKVHTVKSSSLLKFLLCESAKKAAAVAAAIASPFRPASPKMATPDQSKDLINFDASEKKETPIRLDLDADNKPSGKYICYTVKHQSSSLNRW